MSPRRAYAASVLACLLGAALVVAAGGQTWARVDLDRGPGAPAGTLDLVGHTLAAPVTGLGLVGLAGVAALVATSGIVRRVVGFLLDAAGIWVVAVSIVGRSASHVATAASDAAPGATVLTANPTAWPWLSVFGGVLLSIGGAIAVATGARWPSLSRRYDAPGDAATARDDPWAALDRGDDPTM